MLPSVPRDPNAIFTGFGLTEPDDASDEDDDPSELVDEEHGEMLRLARGYGVTVDQLEDTWARFSDRQTVMNVFNVLVALTFCIGVHAALKAFSLHLAEADGAALFRVMYQPVIWWFLPAFGSVCLAWEITIQIWSVFAGWKTIRLYRAWLKQAPFAYKGSTFRNQIGVYHWLSAIIVLPIALFTILALNMHANIGPRGIRTCGYGFKACEELPFDRLATAHFYPAYRKGKTDFGSRVVLSFEDGRKWDSSEWTGASDDIDPALAQFLLTMDPHDNPAR